MAEEVEYLFRLPTRADADVIRAALRRYRATEGENARTHTAEAERAAALNAQLDQLAPPAEG
jgi:Arc/MetJ-type ribon-helix-helix transcriptional regulator